MSAFAFGQSTQGHPGGSTSTSGGGTGTVAASVNQLLSGGGVVWTGNLNFTISAATYQIATNTYSSVQTNVTLATADPTNPRIDAFIVDSTGTASVITGTPAASPAAPSVDATSQLLLTIVLVPANSTTPSVNQVALYQENTEWTCAATANVNCASTSNPYAGTKDIEFTAATTANGVTLTKPSGSINLASYTALSLYIRNKANWPTTRSVTIQAFAGSAAVGTAISFKNGVYGFTQSNTTSYQQIVIPTSAFGSGTSAVTALKLNVAGSGGTIGFYLDNIVVQDSLSGSGSGGTCTNCTLTIASGTATMTTSPVASGAKSTILTITANGVATGDNVLVDFNGGTDPTTITGFLPSTNGTLTIFKYCTANAINFYYVNNTGSSITPGAVTLNWRVVR